MQRALIFILTIIFILLTACGCSGGVSPRHATQTAIMESTLAAAAPTPSPLGSQANPLHIGYVSDQTDAQSLESGSQVAAMLGEMTGYSIELAPQTTYTDLIIALSEGRLHLVWLPPITALATQKLELAHAALIVNHYGVYAYGSQFLANVDLGATAYFDPVSNTNTADVVTALGQFAGLRPCWVEPESTSGYIAPAGILSQVGVITQPAVWSQTSSAVIRSLYVGGVCDFGATFAISGDPRTASDILNDLPDVMSRIKIIWRSDAIIPNLSLSFSSAVDEKMAKNLSNAFMEFNQKPESLAMLTGMLVYDIQGLRPITNSYFDALRSYLDTLQIDPNSLIGK
jgi:phosphonate transport system substrate-binding protein